MWPFSRSSISQGVYHFKGKGEFEGRRIHLRVDSQDKGVLIFDASRMITLNGTGMVFARMILEGATDERIVKAVRSAYKVKAETVRKDLAEFREALKGLLSKGEIVTDMDDELGDIYSGAAAPFRMDLALTYRCDNDCIHCYNEKGRAKKELSTAEWKEVLDRLWKVGIPHIVFTGGEPTLRDDLPDLIAHAEGLGQITGLNTNGRKLSDPDYMKRLIVSGLDHVQITLESSDRSVHESVTKAKGSYDQTLAGIKSAISAGIYTVTNTTIMEETESTALDTVKFMGTIGVKHIAVNALIRSGRGEDAKGVSVDELKDILIRGRDEGILNGYEFRWYTPTQYCILNPMDLDLGIKQCTACRMNMAVEPDGTVIPCQSYYESVGNILKDKWSAIWENPLCESIRTMGHLPDKCSACPVSIQCRGGCSLEFPDRGKKAF
jgi:radical SAM protein with 4Fe4S-binding SPASM domain